MTKTEKAEVLNILKENFLSPITEELNKQFVILREVDKNTLIVRCNLCGHEHSITTSLLKKSKNHDGLIAKSMYEHYGQCSANEEVRQNLEQHIQEARSQYEAQLHDEDAQVEEILRLAQEMDGTV